MMTHLDIFGTTATTSTFVICKCSIVVCSVIIIVPFMVEKELIRFSSRTGQVIPDIIFSTIPVIIIVVITLCATDLNNGATNSQSARQPTNKKSSSINESVSSCLSNTTSITLKLYMNSSDATYTKLLSFWSLTQSDTSHTTRSIKVLNNNSCVV